MSMCRWRWALNGFTAHGYLEYDVRAQGLGVVLVEVAQPVQREVGQRLVELVPVQHPLLGRLSQESVFGPAVKLSQPLLGYSFVALSS